MIRARPRGPHPVGAIGAALFAAMAMTPSLIPRGWLFQGVVSGISAAIGYGLAVGLAAVAVALLRTAPRARRLAVAARRRLPSGAPAAAVLAAVLTAALVVVLVIAAHWQQQLSELMGMPRPTTEGWLRAGPVLLLVAALLVLVARGLRALVRATVGLLARRTAPPLVARALGTLLALGLVALVVGIVVRHGVLGVADDAFAAVNDRPYPGVEAPRAATRSGSPSSSVPWDTLGRQGQAFVAGGRPLAQLAEASGHPAREPVRAYVGLHSAPDAPARADLAVAELERAGGLDRRVVAVVTTTGTGWIGAPVSDGLEAIYGGDSAVVATQYSYLPSWLSFIVDRSRAEEAGRLLIDAVTRRVAALPPERRPRVVVFGESLGSQGSEAAFTSAGDARARTGGILWVGPPGSNRLREELTAARDPGSPEVEPVVDGGVGVRFAGTGPAAARPPAPWDAPRLLYLQYPSDPITWWSPRLLWSRPDWLREPRGSDVLPQMRWYPIVTFWQVTIDMADSVGVPPGHGHHFGADALLRGWASVAAPPGWTDADTDRARRALDP